jgi:preprotein translocase subunit Sec61beta
VTAEGAMEYFTTMEDKEIPITPTTIIIIGCFSIYFIGTSLSFILHLV